jgi:hypothetical protein
MYMFKVIKNDFVSELWRILGAILTFFVHHLFQILFKFVDLLKFAFRPFWATFQLVFF